MKLSLGRQLLLAILLGVFASSGCVDLDNFIQSGKPNNQTLQDPFFAGNEINFNVLTNLSVKRFTLIETLSNTELKDDGRQVLVVSDPSRKVVICVPDRRKQASMAPISPFSTVLDKNQEWAWIEFDPADERRPGYSACKWIDGGLFDHQETKEPIIIDLKKVLSDNPKLTFCYVGHGFDWLEISLAKTMVESRITLNSLRNGRVVTHCSGEDLESVVSGSAININPLSSPPDLCLVLVDSLRPDHLGCYGYERDTSPAIDAFAAGAVRFDQAIASGSWTQPSIMSMMASVPADVHQRVHWGRPHSTNVVTLAETLQKAGYQTVGLVANPMTNRKFGFARGFDFYDDYSLTGAPDATTGDIARQTAQGAKLTRLARDWIEKRRDPEKPLFLFVLYIDVHWDYLPPPPFNRMFAPDPVPPPRDIWNLGLKSVPEAARKRSVAAYDGEIRYTDGCISNLLAAIDTSPRGKDTVVVFCSDHGESFWERGVASHGNALFDEELRVPLVIRPARGDGEPAPPRVVSEQVGLIDLAPTLADLAGVPAPTNWVGRSLAPALRGETLPELPIVLDNRIGDDGAILRGVRTSRWKVLAGPPHDRPTSLYDLLADPAETNDLLRAGDFSLPPEVEALVPLLRPSR